MSDILDKFPRLRDAFAGDEVSLARIKADEDRVTALLQQKEYVELPQTQQLLQLARQQILISRIKLATDRNLTQEQREPLWQLIDARKWLLDQLSQDYDALLADIDKELEAELAR